MKMIRIGALGAALAGTVSGAGPAQAAITFNLTGVTLSSAVSGGTPLGTLTGSFTTNDARTAVTSYNIVASASGSFAGFTYTTANSSVTASVLPSQYFQIDTTGNTNELRLYFTSGLGATGGTISPVFSYEAEPTGGMRFPTGTVVAATAVPEFASWAMMIAGAGMVGVAMRRRQKVRAAITFA